MQVLVFMLIVVCFRPSFPEFLNIFCIAIVLMPFRKVMETKVPDYKSCPTFKVRLTPHDHLGKIRQNDLFHISLT